MRTHVPPSLAQERPARTLEHKIAACLARIALLGGLERIHRIEQRQQAGIRRGLQADQVSRMDDEHAMKSKSRRTWVYVPDAGKEQRRHKLTIGNTLSQLRYEHFSAFLSGCSLHQSDERFDLGSIAHDLRRDLGLTAVNEHRSGETSESTKGGTPGNGHHDSCLFCEAMITGIDVFQRE